MKLENFNAGAGVPTLNQNHLHKIPVLLPPIEEQKKIAAVLSSYDDLIENNKRNILLLEKMTEEIYREWFVRMRFPDHKNSIIEKGIPKNWKKVPLDNVFDYLEGPGIRNWQYTENGFPFINIRLIKNGDIDVSSANYISENEANGTYAHFHLEENDYVVSTSGTLGRGAIVQKYHLPLMLNTSVIRFRSKINVSKSFMYGFLKSDLFVKQIETFATGAAQQNFGPMHLAVMKLWMPNETLMTRFEELCKPIYEQIKVLRTINKNLDKTKYKLLPQLISGKLSVEELDIQFPPSMQDTEAA